MDERRKLEGGFDDPVVGPTNLDTEEQVRTRSVHANPEREEDRRVRTDPSTSSMEKNVHGKGGVDDRGVEDRER
jgi:hypothetical protein